MKKFKFNLESVLKLKKMAVDRETRNLSLVVGEINRLNNEVKENNRTINKETEIYRHQVNTDMNFLRIFEGYIKTLILQNEKLQDQIKRKDLDLSEAISRVVEVRKNEKIYEIIKEKRLLEFKQRIYRAERSEEDENNMKDFLTDRRELRSVPTTEEEPKPKLKKHKKVIPEKSGKQEAKSEYEKLLEYYNQFKNPTRK